MVYLKVRFLAENFCDVNWSHPASDYWTSKPPSTALHAAVRWWRTGIVIALVKDFGANVHARDKRGDTALSCARTEDIAEILLDAGADANAKDRCGRPLLLRVLHPRQPGYLPSVEMVRLLIDRGDADPNVIHNSQTPLRFALMYDIDMVEVLLQMGTNPDLKGLRFNKSPLTIMAFHPDGLQIAELLLEYGASVDGVKDPRGYTYKRTTPLIEAIRGNAIETAKLLVARGADINGLAAGYSPFAMAFLQRNWELMEFFLDSGADINHSQVCIGANPVYVAASELDMTSLKTLFGYGATAHYAAYEGAVFEFCEQKRIYMDNYRYNLSTEFDETAVRDLRQTCFAVLDLLVEHGNALEHSYIRRGDHAISHAAAVGDDDLIRKIMSHGADINGKLSFEWPGVDIPPDADIPPELRIPIPEKHEKLERTVLARALEHTYSTPSTIRCLLDCGADPGVDYQEGFWPLEGLISRGWPCIYPLSGKDICWKGEDWNIAQCILEHKSAGPAITAGFSDGLLAKFLMQAIGSLDGKQDAAERIMLFAKLTNADDRWGPDGLSGLRRLTLCPEYYFDPLVWIESTGKPKMVWASELITRLCLGEGKDSVREYRDHEKWTEW